ncbi:MAG: acylphosphatase [Caldisericia bacterium]
MKKRLEAKVFGIVQGVGFRFFIHYYAKKYNINGYVKNDFDGTVSFVGEGEEDDLKRILDHLKQGPTGAEVREVKFEWKDFKDEFKNFNIK